MKLTKKQKADIFAFAVNYGFWDYFDQCEYVPTQHKYRLVSAQEDKVHYVTQKELADNYDNILSDDERKELTNDYFEHKQLLANAN